MRITLIAAVAANGAIGKDNGLLWHIPEDMKHFRRETSGKPVIMGRKTFESIGRPLPNRTNVVVSRSESFPPMVVPVKSFQEALELCSDAGEEEAMVIGGGMLYAAALPLAHRMILTEVAEPAEGDAYFPDFSRSEWREVSRDRREPQEGPAYSFVTYERTP